MPCDKCNAIAHLVDVKYIKGQTLWIGMGECFDFGESGSSLYRFDIFALGGRPILTEVAEDSGQLIFWERRGDLEKIVTERDPAYGDKLAQGLLHAIRPLTCCHSHQILP